MTCPVCNAQNSAMSARCLECGTILIPEALPRSLSMQRTVDEIDRKLATGYGALAGFVVGFGSWLLLSGDESEARSWLLVAIFTGAALGRFIAWRSRRS